MGNTSPLFNKPLTHPTIQLWKIMTFKTGFKKLSILSKFLEWRIRQGVRESTCLRHYDALYKKIDAWLVPKTIYES